MDASQSARHVKEKMQRWESSTFEQHYLELIRWMKRKDHLPSELSEDDTEAGLDYSIHNLKTKFDKRKLIPKELRLLRKVPGMKQRMH